MISQAKKDWWAKYLVGPIAVALIIGGAWIVWSGFEAKFVPGDMIVIHLHRSYFMLLLGALMPAFGVLILSMLAYTEYEITPSHLVLQSGPSRHRIPLAKIEKAFAVASPWQSGLARGPTWSFDMLRVDYRRKNGRAAASIIFSPANKAEFLNCLSRLLDAQPAPTDAQSAAVPVENVEHAANDEA
jgi:hypothetical protein